MACLVGAFGSEFYGTVQDNRHRFLLAIHRDDILYHRAIPTFLGNSANDKGLTKDWFRVLNPGDEEKGSYMWEKYQMQKGFRQTTPLSDNVGDHEWPEQQPEQS